MNDIQLAELFKKTFGFKKAMANKVSANSMRTVMQKLMKTSLSSVSQSSYVTLEYSDV